MYSSFTIESYISYDAEATTHEKQGHKVIISLGTF